MSTLTYVRRIDLAAGSPTVVFIYELTWGGGQLPDGPRAGDLDPPPPAPASLDVQNVDVYLTYKASTPMVTADDYQLADLDFSPGETAPADSYWLQLVIVQNTGYTTRSADMLAGLRSYSDGIVTGIVPLTSTGAPASVSIAVGSVAPVTREAFLVPLIREGVVADA